jgi:hypothetical protein
VAGPNEPAAQKGEREDLIQTLEALAGRLAEVDYRVLLLAGLDEEILDLLLRSIELARG